MVVYPRHTDKKVINPRADIAPANTNNLEYFMAIMAAIKKVLSPISDTMITERDAIKACTNPNCNLLLAIVNSLFPSLDLIFSSFDIYIIENSM